MDQEDIVLNELSQAEKEYHMISVPHGIGGQK